MTGGGLDRGGRGEGGEHFVFQIYSGEDKS